MLAMCAAIDAALGNVDYRFTDKHMNYIGLKAIADEFDEWVDVVADYHHAAGTAEWDSLIDAIADGYALLAEFDTAFAADPTGQGSNEWSDQFAAATQAIRKAFNAVSNYEAPAAFSDDAPIKENDGDE
jgi:hypothetical protein